jgi:hydrogenase nickel incorporation protein HypB
MCEDCGCGVPVHTARATPQTVEVMDQLLSANRHAAAHNRAHFEAAGVLAVNLMSAPGSGKTSLLEATIDALGRAFRIAVIEGDLETENDARRIRAHGVPAVQITTGTACHLDAHMIHEALHDLSLDAIDLLFIENVGNLVCPASFDLGQHEDVVLLSVTEGDDKPAKYPVMFRKADAVLITKTDLLPYVGEFDMSRAEAALRDLASAAPVTAVSARDPASLAVWLDWLRARAAAVARRRHSHPFPHPCP